MRVIKSYANKTETESESFRDLHLHLAGIYQFMGRKPEPNSLIQQTREWEYPYVILNSNPKAGDKVLDLGGGASPLPLHLADLGCDVEVIDIDSLDNNYDANFGRLWGFVPQFERENLHYIKDDFTKREFLQEYYDKVYCIGVLEHLTQDDADYTKALIPKLLKPNGIAVITYDVPTDLSRVDRLNYHCDVLSEVYIND